MADINSKDLVMARLQQVQGLLAVLAAAGTDRDEFEGLSHRTVMQSLWGMGELVDQAIEASETV
jgi:hypothetical protein